MREYFWSAGIHLSLLLLFAMSGGGASQSDGQAGGEAQTQEQAAAGLDKDEIYVDIIEKPKKDEEKKVSSDDDGYGNVPHGKDVCPDFYGGIGITQVAGIRGPGDYTVIVAVQEVHHGYPAEQAGIQVGDVLLNSSEIRGPIGTTVTVLINRRGEFMKFDIVRDKICTEKHEKEQELTP